MATANASTRGQRGAILDSPLTELTGFILAVDYQSAGCGGERAFAANFCKGRTVRETLRRMRCSNGCGGGVGAVWLLTGPLHEATSRAAAGARGEGVSSGSADVSAHPVP